MSRESRKIALKYLKFQEQSANQYHHHEKKGTFFNPTSDRFVFEPRLQGNPLTLASIPRVFDLQLLLVFPRLEIWFDDLCQQLDAELVDKILRWSPADRIVLKQLVDARGYHHTLQINRKYCRLCESSSASKKWSEEQHQKKIQIWMWKLEKCLQSGRRYSQLARIVWERGIEEERGGLPSEFEDSGVQNRKTTFSYGYGPSGVHREALAQLP